MKRFILSSICLLVVFGFVQAQYSVKSPHSMSEAKVEIGNQITYSIYFNGKSILTNSTIHFEFKQAPPLGEDMTVLKTSEREINETWTPVLKRTSIILNNCKEPSNYRKKNSRDV
jgi:hypothetical protein